MTIMRNILASIFLVLTLVGCEQRELKSFVGEELNGSAIGLSVKVDQGSSSRSVATLLRSASEVGSIGLYAYVVRPNGVVEVLGENLKLNYVEGESLWAYDDESLAPVWGYTDGSDRYTFYAYAPYRADGSGVSFDADSDEFSVDYDMSDNQDLMVAKTSGIVCPAGGVVTLDLKHTLTAISLNTTYSSVITNVELVVSDGYYSAMPMAGTVGLDENGVVKWRELEYATTAERFDMENHSQSYMLLLPQTTKNKGDLFFSITSIVKGKIVVDENAKIPAMSLASSGIYKFNYKEPYFDLDDYGDLVVNIDKFYEHKENVENNGGGLAWNDYTAIDEMIEKIKEAGHSTLKVVGQPANPTDAYHIINHILKNGGLENYDMSGYVIPENTVLPYNLFQKNSTLKSLVLPQLSDGQLLDNSFWGCSALESVVFSEGQNITALPNAAFKGCAALTTVKLDMTSDKLKTISQSVFEGCSGLVNIELPKSVENIGYGAFSGCKSLSSINIPASVTDIAGQAFMNCTSLYSYGERRGIVFDERSAQDTPITVGWHGFFSTHVRYGDIPDGYVNIQTSGVGYFSEP